MQWGFKIALGMCLLGVNALACSDNGSVNYVKDESYDFFDASLVGLEKDSPLYYLSTDFFQSTSYNDRSAYYEEQKKKINIAEWYGYCNHALTQKELEKLFYTSYSYEADLSAMTPIVIYRQSFKSRLKNGAFEGYLNYLSDQMRYTYTHGYAKTTEGAKEFNRILTEGKRLMEQTSDPMLKLRYLYLVVRFDYYGGNYAKVVEYCTQYKNLIHSPHPSVAHEWIDAFHAGALNHLGKGVQGNAMAATLLDNQTNPYLGIYDFRIKNDAQWQGLLKSAKTNEDKARYFFLRAQQWKNSPLHEHREMATFGSHSIWFERLTYMVLQDLHASYYRGKHSPKALKSYQLKRDYFVQTLKSLPNPPFVEQYALLYLDLLEQKPLNAEAFERLKHQKATQAQQKFIPFLTYLNRVNGLKNQEELPNLYHTLFTLTPQFSPTMKDALIHYTGVKAGTLYPPKSIQRTIFATLTPQYDVDRWVSVDYDGMDPLALENYWVKTPLSPLEKHIFDRYLDLNSSARTQILGTLFIKHHNYPKAIEYLQKTSKDLLTVSDYNPFNATFGGYNRNGKTVRMTQLSYAKKMQILYGMIAKDPHNPHHHFLLATALYNQSYFGNFSQSSYLYRPRSNPSLSDMDTTGIQKEYALASHYTQDPELKAKIAYGELKLAYHKTLYPNEVITKLNSTTLSWEASEKLLSTDRVKRSKSFAQHVRSYKATYQGTQYGQQAIKACATFKAFR